jgi:uncharacterized protein YkwD
VHAGALAFLIIWFVTLNAYFLIARRLYRRVPRGIRRSWGNRILGALPGLVRGIILVAVLLTMMVALPTPFITQDTVDRSVLAPPLVNTTATVTAYAADVFGETIQSALGFLTVEPKTGERVNLRFRVQSPMIDPAAEEQMLILVNQERIAHGLRPLVMVPKIREVARRHCIDMFRRGYFAHDTPEVVSPFQRMSRGGVRYALAGENLALAPTVRLAHSGLMRSPGHRENILRPQFRRVGIGAARGGRYGIMFTQDFAN